MPAACRAPRSRPAPSRSCGCCRSRVGDDLTLVSVGGITTAEDAAARLEAGATLLQGYTAFVYEGPLWPRRLVRGLDRLDRRTPATA